LGFVYIIKNKINSKVYIGKTEKGIQRRFKEHINDHHKVDTSRRPLHDAMKKYGADQFYVELLLETNKADAIEQQFIREHNSYVGFKDSNGYNATLGGDGRRHLNFDELGLVRDYILDESLTVNSVAKVYGICADTARYTLRNAGIQIRDCTKNLGMRVVQFTKEGKYVSHHDSAGVAARALGKSNGSHISACLRGTRKGAYGFIWK
jgi:hypothetical protein